MRGLIRLYERSATTVVATTLRREEEMKHIAGLVAAVSGALVVGTRPAICEEGHWAAQREETKAHFEEQKKENQEFRQQIKGELQKEKIEAVEQHRTAQYNENKAFFQKQHEENIAYLKERLARVKALTDEEKNGLISFFEQQYAENVAFREERFNDLMANFEKIANDNTMNFEAKKQAIKDMIAKWKEATKAHHEQQKSERKAKIEALRKAKQSE